MGKRRWCEDEWRLILHDGIVVEEAAETPVGLALRNLKLVGRSLRRRELAAQASDRRPSRKGAFTMPEET